MFYQFKIKHFHPPLFQLPAMFDRFQLSVESNSHLLWFCLQCTLISKMKLSPLSRSIRSKPSLPRLPCTCICLELLHYGHYVLSLLCLERVITSALVLRRFRIEHRSSEGPSGLVGVRDGGIKSRRDAGYKKC